MKKYSQLSLFKDSDVQRSFLCRFSKAPNKRLISRFRMENLHGLKFTLLNELSICAFNTSCMQLMQTYSLELHFNNRKNRNITKRKGKYFYNEVVLKNGFTN